MMILLSRLGLVPAALLFSALTLPGHAAEDATAALTVLPFTFLDTSGEMRDQAADHEARLKRMASTVASGVSSPGGYRIVEPSAALASCQRTDSACLLGAARAAGADLILVGALQKVSTMATQLWAAMFDTGTGQRLFFRQMTFRGDTDQAWDRAAMYLSQEIQADPPKRR
jgi:hypothetical protein